VRVRVSRSDNSHAVAVQWLHAAQAPVRPRHCPQALLQQPDQLILSNTLPRPASSLEQCPSAPWLGPAKSTQARRFAEGRRHDGAEMWGGGNRAKCHQTDTGQMSSDRHHHHTFCVTIYWGCCAGCTLYIHRVHTPECQYMNIGFLCICIGSYIYILGYPTRYNQHNAPVRFKSDGGFPLRGQGNRNEVEMSRQRFSRDAL